MTEYHYNLDIDSLEIFPEEIYKDPFVVFHGTSSYHSESIERNGFIKSRSPFNLDQARELIRILKLPEIIAYDTPSIIGMTQAQSLQDYTNAIDGNYFRLSFSCLSYQCVLFSSGQSKGGQAVGTIRRAKQIISKAITDGIATNAVISEPVSKLFNLIENIENAQGIIYAIKLPDTLEEITLELNVVYSSQNISVNSIVGKVFLPEYIEQIDKTTISKKLSDKLYNARGLGPIINRREFNED